MDDAAYGQLQEHIKAYRNQHMRWTRIAFQHTKIYTRLRPQSVAPSHQPMRHPTRLFATRIRSLVQRYFGEGHA
jgi:hypothetical protein